jgi:hypothetical protein
VRFAEHMPVMYGFNGLLEAYDDDEAHDDGCDAAWGAWTSSIGEGIAVALGAGRRRVWFWSIQIPNTLKPCARAANPSAPSCVAMTRSTPIASRQSKAAAK